MRESVCKLACVVGLPVRTGRRFLLNRSRQRFTLQSGFVAKTLWGRGVFDSGWLRIRLTISSSCSLPSSSMRQRLLKTGGRLVKHARYYWLLLAETHLTRGCLGYGAADCGLANAGGWGRRWQKKAR